jgi:hypothetical protein
MQNYIEAGTTLLDGGIAIGMAHGNLGPLSCTSSCMVRLDLDYSLCPAGGSIVPTLQHRNIRILSEAIP